MPALKLGRPLHFIQKQTTGRTHGGIEQSGERVYNILGGHFSPVVELHTFAKMKGPDEAVTRRRPGLSQGGHHVEVSIKRHQAIKNLVGNGYPIHISDLGWIEAGGILSQRPSISTPDGWHLRRLR